MIFTFWHYFIDIIQIMSRFYKFYQNKKDINFSFLVRFFYFLMVNFQKMIEGQIQILIWSVWSKVLLLNCNILCSFSSFFRGESFWLSASLPSSCCWKLFSLFPLIFWNGLSSFVVHCIYQQFLKGYQVLFSCSRTIQKPMIRCLFLALQLLPC